MIQIKVHWFQYESDTSLNSNAYEEGSRVRPPLPTHCFTNLQRFHDFLQFLMSAKTVKRLR